MTNDASLPCLRILPLGDTGLTVEFGDAIDPAINERVLAFARAVEGLRLPGVSEVVPTYRSATVYFDPVVVDAGALAERLRGLAGGLPALEPRAPRIIEIPVAYGGEFGPDLPDVADRAGLSADAVVTLHGSVEYRVYMLGFSPGFPYLGKVPDAIAVPRLAEPRARVAAGSVGIAGSQTGIYPHESPGGWRLLGRTPLRLYDPARARPFLLAAGDRVRFVAISREEFARLAHRAIE